MNIYRIRNGTVKVSKKKPDYEGAGQMVILDDCEKKVYETDRYTKFVYDFEHDHMIIENGEDDSWEEVYKAIAYVISAVYTAVCSSVSVESGDDFRNRIAGLFAEDFPEWDDDAEGAEIVDAAEEREIVESFRYMRWLVEPDSRTTFYFGKETPEVHELEEAMVKMIAALYLQLQKNCPKDAAMFYICLRRVCTKNPEFWIPDGTRVRKK